MAKKWIVEIGDRLILNKTASSVFVKDSFYGVVEKITPEIYYVRRVDGALISYTRNNEDFVFRRWVRKEVNA